MRLIKWIPLGLGLAACSTVSQQTVEPVEPPNPAILERIEARLEEAKDNPAPDVRNVPSQGPAIPTQAQLLEQRAAILEEQAALRSNVTDDRKILEEEALALRAEALKAKIAHDRALMEAEGLLSKMKPVIPDAPTKKTSDD